jgi:putative transposase
MKSQIKRTYKYRIYPSRAHETCLENMFSMCRHLYNWNLKERIERYELEKHSVSYNEQQNKLPELKKEKPWFKGVHSQVLQDVLRRLDNGFKHFFRRVKTGEVPGFPKYKKRGEWNSITYTQFSDHPKDGSVKVPKLGNISIVYHRSIPKDAKVKTLNIEKEAGKWFACFSFEHELEIEPKQELSAIGIDLGLIDFYYTSDGQSTSAPKLLRKKEKQLQKLHKRLSKTKKRTPEFYKLVRAIQKTHFRIKCQRNDFLHKQSLELLKSANILCFEKLTVSKMVKRPEKIQGEFGVFLPNGAKYKAMLNKSISDVGWSKFVDILKYKVVTEGKKLVQINPKYTSQECSNCGAIVKKSLSTRTHRCNECGYVANRDENAAINILRRGLASLGITLEAHTIAEA